MLRATVIRSLVAFVVLFIAAGASAPGFTGDCEEVDCGDIETTVCGFEECLELDESEKEDLCWEEAYLNTLWETPPGWDCYVQECVPNVGSCNGCYGLGGWDCYFHH